MSSRVSASSAANGSSISSTEGLYASARDGDPLLHPAGQMVRVGLYELFELHQLELRERNLFALGLADPSHLEPEGHVAERGAPREQLGEVLKHHAAVGAVTADRFAADADLARGGGEKAGDDVEQRRLTAARGPDDAKELRGLDVEADAGDARDLPGGRVVDERDVADFDMGPELRAAVINGMRVCGQTRAVRPGRVSLESNSV